MDLETELTNFLGERRALVDAMVREFGRGASGREIARAVAPAFGRDVVKTFLSAVAIANSARKALTEAEMSGVVDVVLPGIDLPREARLVVASDPSETDDFANLPARVRAALRDFHITIAPPGGAESAPEGGGAGADDLLLAGEFVRLVKLRPRS
ncbi:hypothetical protein [Nocardia noduli]|uniref:hypothetical protein n=1 Tax=Nocardia noduli TaxID=2815722 RepID=UPI001C21714B|nr:hypothetical protein [Nocardia noduli]